MIISCSLNWLMMGYDKILRKILDNEKERIPLKDLEEKLDAVLEQMRDYIEGIQEQGSAYPMFLSST